MPVPDPGQALREAAVVLAPVPAFEWVTGGHPGFGQPEAAKHQVDRGILFAFLGEQERDWAAASGRHVCPCGCGVLRAVSSKHVSQSQPASSTGPCAGAEGLGAGVSNLPLLRADLLPGPSSKGCAGTLTTRTPHPTSSLLLEPASPHPTLERYQLCPFRWCSACAHGCDFQRGCVYPNTSNELPPSSPQVHHSHLHGRRTEGSLHVGMVTPQAFLRSSYRVHTTAKAGPTLLQRGLKTPVTKNCA